jgi:hypothetical protein
MWGRGLKMSDIPADALFDAVKSVPARPTISNLQWIMGTQYIRTEDLNLLSIHLLRPTNVKLVVQIDLSPNLKQRNSTLKIDNALLSTVL